MTPLLGFSSSISEDGIIIPVGLLFCYLVRFLYSSGNFATGDAKETSATDIGYDQGTT